MKVNKIIKIYSFQIGGALTLLSLVLGAIYADYFFPSTAEAASLATTSKGLAVDITVVEPQAASVWRNFSGRLTAVDRALIKPRVSGSITEVRFTDGEVVDAGDVLFVIDPRPYRVAVDHNEALVEQAQAQVDFAKKQLGRAAALVKSQALSESVYDKRLNELKVAKAALASAKAQLEQAEIALDFAYVKSPISGRVGRVEVTLGNLVQAGPNAPVLTSVVANDNIYVDFEVDEATYVNVVRSSARSRVQEVAIPVNVTTSSNSLHSATIHTFDNTLDSQSGTIRARALIDNSENVLLPGMYVEVGLGSTEQKALLVPERAIGTDQDRKFVYIVDNEKKAAYREVTVGERVNGQRVILDGLQTGDQVVVSGLIRVRPDTLLEPTLKQASLKSTHQETSV